MHTTTADDRSRQNHPPTHRLRALTSSPELALHVEQLDVEDQRGVRGDDAAGATGSVAELGRNDEGTLAPDLHGGDTLVPARDDSLPADRKFERPAAVER